MESFLCTGNNKSVEVIDVYNHLSPKPKAPKTCKICYRPANGFHYGIPSCKGCKTFFRRTNGNGESYKCKRKNDCYDNPENVEVHIRCISCRYRKCLKEGMDSNQFVFTTSTKSETNTSGIISTCSINSANNIMMNIVENLFYLNSKIEKFRLSAYNPPNLARSTLSELVCSPSIISLADNYGPMSGWPLKQEDIKQITRPVQSRIRGVQTDPVPFHPHVKRWFQYNTLISIEYAKVLPFFDQLSSNDRIALMTHVAVICSNLHQSYFAVSKKADYCLQPDGAEAPLKEYVS